MLRTIVSYQPLARRTSICIPKSLASPLETSKRRLSNSTPFYCKQNFDVCSSFKHSKVSFPKKEWCPEWNRKDTIPIQFERFKADKREEFFGDELQALLDKSGFKADASQDEFYLPDITPATIHDRRFPDVLDNPFLTDLYMADYQEKHHHFESPYELLALNWLAFYHLFNPSGYRISGLSTISRTFTVSKMKRMLDLFNNIFLCSSGYWYLEKEVRSTIFRAVKENTMTVKGQVNLGCCEWEFLPNQTFLALGTFHQSEDERDEAQLLNEMLLGALNLDECTKKRNGAFNKDIHMFMIDLTGTTVEFYRSFHPRSSIEEISKRRSPTQPIKVYRYGGFDLREPAGRKELKEVGMTMSKIWELDPVF